MSESVLEVYRLKYAFGKHPAGTLVGLREFIDEDTAEIAFPKTVKDAKWHQIPADAIELVPDGEIPEDLAFGV